jgi:hypothetical protein
MTTTDITGCMNFIVDNRGKDLPAPALSEVFDRLIWCLADNGSQLLRIREQWLLSDDRYRVEIGLAMEETYPFNTIVEMRHAFARIVARWPDLRARCDEITASRGDKE